MVGHTPAHAPAHAPVNVPVMQVACLCAAWCRLCVGWRRVQQQVAAGFEAEGVVLRWHWIDIEDDAELLGDVDVETFPTVVVVACDGMVRFAGPLAPQAGVLRRVLRSCLDDGASAARRQGCDAAMAAFAARLASR